MEKDVDKITTKVKKEVKKMKQNEEEIEKGVIALANRVWNKSWSWNFIYFELIFLWLVFSIFFLRLTIRSILYSPLVNST